MLISESRKFVFVHIPKAAGTSIKKALNAFGETAIDRLPLIERLIVKLEVRLFGRYRSKDTLKHQKAIEIRESIRDLWNECFTFAFVRNPWARQVSLYHFMQQTKGHRFHEKVSKMERFDEYIDWMVDEEKIVLQSEYVCNEEGRIMVDYVGRIETLKKDFNEICDTLEIEASIPHINKSNHRKYTEYYNDRTKQVIKNMFQKDIKLFNYCFDGIKNKSPIV